jgi:hypothetical protein
VPLVSGLSRAGTISSAPGGSDFFRTDLDEGDWQATSVPERNYGIHERKDGHGAILCMQAF